jgi:hypothetical protein
MEAQMADSRAVDAAQAAGFTVASTSGAVTGPVSAGALHRLQRIVETAGGEVEFTDNGVKASKTLYAGVAGKEIVVEADAVGTAGNAINIIIAVPADDNQAHAIDYAEAGNDRTVTLAVDTDGSTVLSTAADVVAKINADGTDIHASLGGSYAAQSAKAYCIFEDIAQSGDDLIFTGKTNGVGFTVSMREPRGRAEEALTSVTVSVDDKNSIRIIVPAGKTVANVKTAVEANTAANALVAVTTAGTTSHAVVVPGRTTTKAGSFANRGEVLATAVATQDLAGGTASAMTLRVTPAVA